MNTVIDEMIYQGVGVCHGIAIGPLFLLYDHSQAIARGKIEKKQVSNEVERYRHAVDKSIRDIQSLKLQLELENVKDAVQILDAHLQIILDPSFTLSIEKQIHSFLDNAETAHQTIINSYMDKFNAMSNTFFKERHNDLQDVSKRILSHLQGALHSTLKFMAPDSIVISCDLSACEAIEATTANAAGVATLCGGATTHAAIVLKAKGVPYAAALIADIDKLVNGVRAILDGVTGMLIVDPSEETLNYYRHKQQQQLDEHTIAIENASLHPVTTDGVVITLSSNIDMLHEIDLFHSYGGDGVGLFRSENIFMNHVIIPSEEEQYLLYKSAVEKMRGMPIVFRTFDIGADKWGPHPLYRRESNPFLGCRAIRFLLKEHTIFKAHLRAIVRAAVCGVVKILFPMISTLSELLEAKALLSEVLQELRIQGCDLPDTIDVGCMIEVPSAALIADMLAKECDFLSIGTNDLVQYALAADRGNNMVQQMCTPAHPSVLRLIKIVTTEAKRCDIPVSVCGEAATDPRFTALFLGLGVTELSVTSRYIPMIKNTIRRSSFHRAVELAEKALTLTTTQQIIALLEEEYLAYSLTR